MAIYVGEAITVRSTANSPTTGDQLPALTGTVEFYAPPKLPASNVSDRVVDKGPFTMTWDAAVVNKDSTTGAYVAYVDTAGWDAGKWFFRVALQGDVYDSWEYGSVTLKP